MLYCVKGHRVMCSGLRAQHTHLQHALHDLRLPSSECDKDDLLGGVDDRHAHGDAL